MHDWHQSRYQTYCRGAHAAGRRKRCGTYSTAPLPRLCERATEVHRANRTENLREMLSKPESAKAAAKWMLEQFNTARPEIEAEDAAQYAPFQELDS
jgi:hypothetical protein